MHTAGRSDGCRCDANGSAFAGQLRSIRSAGAAAEVRWWMRWMRSSARFFLQRFYVFDFRTLHLLQSALNLATCQLRDGTLKPSDSVKNGKIFAETNDKHFCDTNISVGFVFVVISILTNKYRTTVYESKRLNGTGLIQTRRDWRPELRADLLLYQYALAQVSIANCTKITRYINTFRFRIAVENGGRRRTVWQHGTVLWTVPIRSDSPTFAGLA